MRQVLVFVSLIAAGLIAGSSLWAADEASYTLTIKDHRFEPTELTLPAATKVKLVVKNLDATAEEFESAELHREKVVAAGAQIVVNVGPLKPGVYKFFGDFHKDTAQGQITVK